MWIVETRDFDDNLDDGWTLYKAFDNQEDADGFAEGLVLRVIVPVRVRYVDPPSSCSDSRLQRW